MMVSVPITIFQNDSGVGVEMLQIPLILRMTGHVALFLLVFYRVMVSVLTLLSEDPYSEFPTIIQFVITFS